MKQLELGSKWVWIPMLVIIASIFLRLIVSFDMKTLSSACFGLLLFGSYLISYKYGNRVLWIFPIATAIEAVSVIIQGVFVPGEYAGGIITSPLTLEHTVNYDIATGYLIFGWLLSGKWRAWLTPFVLIALFFTGASEAVFVVAVIGAAVLIRRDWNKVMLASVIVTVIVAGVWFSMGHGTKLYAWAMGTARTAITGDSLQANGYDYESPLWGRIRVIGESFGRMKILGNGFTVVDYTVDTVHNVPLVIQDQIGIMAALAWSVVTIYCLIKTKWKYAWIGLIALCVFDHFVWTQLAPLWWVLAGVSTREKIENDYIFKSNSSHTLLQ